VGADPAAAGIRQQIVRSVDPLFQDLVLMAEGQRERSGPNHVTSLTG
jgi:hypothetical protein